MSVKTGKVLVNGKEMTLSEFASISFGDSRSTFPFAMRSGRLLEVPPVKGVRKIKKINERLNVLRRVKK